MLKTPPYKKCPKCCTTQPNATRLCKCGYVFLRKRKVSKNANNKWSDGVTKRQKKCPDCDVLVAVAFKVCPHCEYIFIPGGVRLSPGECGQVMNAVERIELKKYIAKRKAARDAKRKDVVEVQKPAIMKAASIFDAVRPISDIEQNLAAGVKQLIKRLRIQKD